MRKLRINPDLERIVNEKKNIRKIFGPAEANEYDLQGTTMISTRLRDAKRKILALFALKEAAPNIYEDALFELVYLIESPAFKDTYEIRKRVYYNGISLVKKMRHYTKKHGLDRTAEKVFSDYKKNNPENGIYLAESTFYKKSKK